MQVVRDPVTQKSTGSGFVQYREYAHGVKAMQHWNGKQLGGRTLEVVQSMPSAMPLLLPGMGADLLGMSLAGFGTIPGVGAGGAADPNFAAAFMAQQMAAQQQAQAQAQLQLGQPGATMINELEEADEEGKGGLKLDAQRRVALMQRLAAGAGMDAPKPSQVRLCASGASRSPSSDRLLRCCALFIVYSRRYQCLIPLFLSSSSLPRSCSLSSTCLSLKSRRPSFWTRGCSDRPRPSPRPPSCSKTCLTLQRRLRAGTRTGWPRSSLTSRTSARASGRCCTSWSTRTAR